MEYANMSAVPSPSKCVTLWVECNWDCIWEISSLRLDWIQHKCVAYVSCHVLLLSFPLVLASLSCLKKHTHGFMLKVAAAQHTTILHNHNNLCFVCPSSASPSHTRTRAHTHTPFFSPLSCHASHWEQSNSVPQISITAAHIFCSTLGPFAHSHFQYPDKILILNFTACLSLFVNI